MIVGEAEARDFCAGRVGVCGLARLKRLAELLVVENAAQNLVSATSLANVWLRHFADSLQLSDHVPRGTGPWLDLGSGAGFPGIPLAIAFPDSPVVLVESRKRRADWLTRVSNELELANCRVSASRLENVETFAAGAIVARAFAPLPKLLQLSARFSTHDTVWLLPKGRSAAQELAQQPQTVQRMFHVERSQTDPDAGLLIGKGTPAAR